MADGSSSGSGRVIEVNDETFDREVLSSTVPVLVDFGATWCAPCRALHPIVERLAAEQAGRIKVVTLDTDDSPRTAQRYGVRAVPTVLVFRNGEKTASHLGVTSKERLLALLDAGA